MNETARAIQSGKTYLGLELGSTRIKAVLIDQTHAPIAQGSFAWENRLENGVWTYALEDAWAGVRACYADLAANVKKQYGVPLQKLGAFGVSGMMHGYLPFDRNGKQLAAFRTWRNTMTQIAAERLTEAFGFSIPQRWSVAHLYQSILQGEAHVCQIDYLTTLAGYLHWRFSGERVLGVGEASGMFPIDANTHDYDPRMLDEFDRMTADRGYAWKLKSILPRVCCAGESAGTLTKEGALLLDPSGTLEAGVPMCPPEGDAGTGMTATNSVRVRTGNVSAGTSIFAMAVLEKPLSRVHPEIDMVTTPAGDPVAMVHCNNCTGDLDAWLRLFSEATALFGEKPGADALYDTLYRKAFEGDADCGGLLSYNYFAGEHVACVNEGRPLFARRPDSAFTLANFMRAHLYTALATLRMGMDVLFIEEQVALDELMGHGGFFKAAGAGQRVVAAALDTPVSVMQTAGEGGPWGMALLAAYSQNKQAGQGLDDYLARRVFAENEQTTVAPDPADKAGFDAYLARFRAGLAIERAAIQALE